MVWNGTDSCQEATGDVAGNGGELETWADELGDGPVENVVRADGVPDSSGEQFRVVEQEQKTTIAAAGADGY